MSKPSNTIAREYLRQALASESPRPGWFDLHRLYDEAPDCTMAPPHILKFGGKAIHGKDPLEGSEVINGRVHADSILAANYVMNVGGLGEAYYDFIDEVSSSDDDDDDDDDSNYFLEVLTRNPTADRVFFVVALTLEVNAEEGRDWMTAGHAMNYWLSQVRASENDAESRLLTALFGNEIPPALTAIGA